MKRTGSGTCNGQDARRWYITLGDPPSVTPGLLTEGCPLYGAPGTLQLRKRMYWVIAIVLSAYWAREVLSMLMTLPYASRLTRRMILASTVYHTYKASLICLDAKRG